MGKILSDFLSIIQRMDLFSRTALVTLASVEPLI